MGDEAKKDAFDAYQGRTMQTVNNDVPLEGGEEKEFHVSLTATAKDHEQAQRLFAKFSATALDVAHDSTSQMVSRHDFNDADEHEPGEFYNEGTMFKVQEALKTVGVMNLTYDEIWDVINKLLNAGIMFRERR